MTALPNVNSRMPPGLMDLHYDPPQINKIIEIQPYQSSQNLRRIVYLDSVNAYLLVSDDGTVLLLEGSFESAPDQICSFSEKIHVSYANVNGSLILLNNQKISIRRDHRGVYCMKTAFDSIDNGIAKLELSLDEATEWSAYFAARSSEEFRNRPTLLRFGQLIDEALTNHISDKACVVVDIDAHKLFEELVSLTNGLAETHEYIYPIFPYAFGTIERLRLLLHPRRPYTPQSSDSTRKCIITKSELNSEAARLLTFNRWPHSHYRYAIPSKMSEAGFYHQPNERGEDRVLCFLCNVCLVYWEPSDEPYQEHERHSSSCRFISNMVNSNVPLSLTMSAIAPIPIDLSNGTLLDSHAIITSFMTSSTEWFAIASSENSKPVIQLFHLDSITQAPLSFTVDLNDPFFTSSFELAEHPRRPHRVTWLDDSAPAQAEGKTTEEQKSMKPIAQECTKEDSIPAVQITTLCSMGISYTRPHGAFLAVGPETTVDSVLVVGVGVLEAKIKKKDHSMEVDVESSEVNALNTVNLSSEASSTPRIETSMSESIQDSGKRRPFILVYHILRTSVSNESNSNKSKDDVPSKRKPRTTSDDKTDSSTQASESDLAKNQEKDLKDAEKKLDEAMHEVMMISNDHPVTIEQSTPMDYEFVTLPDASDSSTTTMPIGDYYPEDGFGSGGFGDPVTIKSASTGNPVDITYIYYEQKETSTVAMQCIKLPEELDSPEFKVEQIVASENGIIAVAVNRVSTEPSESFNSALVIYSCSCGMIQETCLRKFTYAEGQIRQVLLLPLDFFLDCSQRDLFPENAILRFSDGRLLLVDLHTNRSVKVCDEKAVDITIGDNGTLVVLSDNGSVLNFEIKQSLPRLKSDEDEEMALSMISTLPSNSIDENFIQRLSEHFKDHPKLKSVLSMIENLPVFHSLSFSTMRKLWVLVHADPTPLPSLSATPSGFGVHTSPTASVLLHASSGFQMQAPAAWIESHLFYKSKKSHTSTGSATPHKKEEYPPPTRSWIFSPGIEAILSSYVFELTILPGMPISHMNITLKFQAQTLSPNVTISLLRLIKEANKGRDSTMTTSQHASSLTYYSENLKSLQEKCETVFKSQPIANFLEASSPSSTIQISGTTLLKSIVASSQEGAQPGWMMESQIFYLVVEGPGKSQQEASRPPGFLKPSIPTKSEKSKKPTAIMILKKNQTEMSSISDSFGLNSNKPENIMQCLEELSLTIYRSLSPLQSYEKMQRLILKERPQLHSELLRLASLSVQLEVLIGDSKKVSRDRLLLVENQALDVLIRLISGFTPENLKERSYDFSSLASQIIDSFEKIYQTGYESAYRMISHKWTVFFTEFIQVYEATDSKACGKFLFEMLKKISGIIPRIFKIKKSGSLHELFVLIFVIMQTASFIDDQELKDAMDSISACCIDALTNIGQAWEKKWVNSVYQKLSVHYQLSGFPLDLLMYDWPQQVISMRYRNAATASYNSTKTAGIQWSKPVNPTMPFASSFVPYQNMVNSVPMPSAFPPSSYPALFSTPSAVQSTGFQPYSAFKNTLGWISEDPSAFPPLEPPGKSSSKAQPAINGQDVVASAKFGSEMAVDELQFLDLFNVKDLQLSMTQNEYEHAFSASNKTQVESWKNFSEINEATNTNPPTTYQQYNDWNKTKESKNLDLNGDANSDVRRSVISHENLSGLLEAEPLAFQVVRGSDHMRLHNISENASTMSLRVPSDLSENDGIGVADPSMAKTVEEKNPFDTRLIDVESKNLAKVYSLKHHLAQEQPETQASSASTFGVPTTPKTTPFLTPTPLSPINSQPDLTELEADNEKLDLNRSTVNTTSSILSHDLFKPPPILVLAVERMTAGSKKFVVLDFGTPVLLSDIVIPSCEYTNTVYVDTWMKNEQTGAIENYHRIVTCHEIDRKSVSLSNITPRVLARFIKATYIVKQLYTGVCRIPLGRFYGSRFFSSYELYPSIPEKASASIERITEQGELSENIDDLNKELKKLYVHQNNYLPALRQLSEDLRCRYQLAASELTSLLKMGNPDVKSVKTVYKQCMSWRLQWNIAHNVLQRIESDHGQASIGSQILGTTTLVSWDDCTLEQLQIISVNLFSFMDSTAHLKDLGNFVKETSRGSQPHMLSKLTLETAIQQFGFFCKNAVPTLQAHCCTWLFNQGILSDWWPEFFPAVLRKHFSLRDDIGDRLFMTLSYLVSQTVKYPHYQGRVMEKLIEFLDELLSENNTDPTNVRASLLPWTLLLISTVCDVIVANKRRTDRWAFLAGEFAIYSSSIGSTAEKDPKETISKNSPLYKLATTKSSVAKAYMKKYADKIDALMNKPIPPEEKLHELQARLKCLYQIYNGLAQEVDGSQPSSSSASGDKSAPLVTFDEISELLEESEAKSAAITQAAASIAAKSGAIAKKHKAIKSITGISSAIAANAPFATGLKRRVSSSTPKQPKESRSSNTNSRVRQYSVRLKLNFALCESVTKKLLELLANDSVLLTSSTHLLACKIVAKIGVHACHFPIPLKSIMDQNLKALVYNAINDENTWFRHAILCLLLDLTDAEVRTISRVNSTMTTSSSAPTISAAPLPSITETDMPVGELTASSSTENMDTSEAMPSSSTSTKPVESPQIAKRHKSEQDLPATSQPQSSSSTATPTTSQEVEQPVDTIKNLTNEKSNSKLDQIQTTYFAFNGDAYLQPMAASIGQHSMQTFGFHAMLAYRKSVLFKDILSKIPPRRFMLAAKPRKSTAQEDMSMLPLIGTSVPVVMNSLHEMIAELENDMPATYVERLLSFYWNFYSNVNATLATNKTVTQVTIPTFSPGAVESLLKYLTSAPMLTEQSWRLILQTLDSALRKEPQLISSVIEDEHLQKLLERFMGDSLNKFGNNMSYGNSITRTFIRFFEQLLNASSRANFVEKTIRAILAVLSSKGEFVYAPYPVDIMLAITDKLASDPAKYMSCESCDENVMVELFEAVVNFAKSYLLRSINSAKRSSDGTFQPFMCFSSFSPSATTPTELTSQPPGLAPPGFSSTKPIAMEIESEGQSSSQSMNDVDDAPPVPVIHPQDTIPSMDMTSNSIEYDSMNNTVDFPYIDDGDIFEDDSGFDEIVNLDRYKMDNGNEGVRLDQHDNLLLNLFKIIGTSILGASKNENSAIITTILAEKSGVMNNLLEILFKCDSSMKSIEAISTENWRLVSVADHCLYCLLSISNYCGIDGENARHLITSLLSFIDRRTQKRGDRKYGPALNRPLEIKLPIVYLLTKLLNSYGRKKLFAELGGHLFVASQLEKGLDASTENWPIGGALTPLSRQLAEISNKMTGIQLPAIGNPPKAPEAKFDGLFNFAPISTVTSSSPSAHHLHNLTASNAPHRRTRTPIWSYHFQPDQQWLEITVVLPYQAVITEMNLKAHLQSLGTSPSAVQVELCPEPSLASWMIVNSPIPTYGLNRISVPINYELPINAVRLHLKRPSNSDTMSLSQLMVLGILSKTSLYENTNPTTNLVNWLTIFNRLIVASEPTVWNYAPHLPEKLAHLFVSRPLPAEVLMSMSQTLTNIDNKAKTGSTTIVGLLIKYLANGGYVCHTAQAWLVESLFKYCTITSLPHVPVSTSQNMAQIRQRQLLEGIVTLMDRQQSGSINLNQKTLASLLWSTSCVVWQNLNEELMRYETMAEVLEIGSKAIDHLLKAAIESRSAIMKTSSCWLLASFVRANRSFIETIVKKMNLSSNKEPSAATLWALGKIGQSGNAANFFIENKILDEYAELAISICEGELFARIDLLVALVELFASLSVIESVRQFFETPIGLQLIKVLMCFIVKHSHSIMSSVNSMSSISSHFIELVTKCRAFSDKIRQSLAYFMCELLQQLPSHELKNTSLNGALQQLVMKLILEDEPVTVRFTDVIDTTSSSGEIFEEKIRHPIFGCNRNDRLVDISLYTLCKDLLPVQKTEPIAPTVPAPGMNSYYSNATYPEDMGDSYDAYGFPIYYTKPKPKKKTPSTNDNVDCFTRLFCDNLSMKQALDGECSLEMILHAFKEGLSRRPSRQDLSMATSRTMTPTNAPSAATYDDGYFSLTLRIKAINIQEEMKDENSLLTVPKVKENSSTLIYFAKGGGLSILSQHLPVYQHYMQLCYKCDEFDRQLNEHKAKQRQTAATQQSVKPKKVGSVISYNAPSDTAEIEIFDNDGWSDLDYGKISQASTSFQSTSTSLQTQTGSSGAKTIETATSSEPKTIVTAPYKWSSAIGGTVSSSYLFDDYDFGNTFGTNVGILTNNMIPAPPPPVPIPEPPAPVGILYGGPLLGYGGPLPIHKDANKLLSTTASKDDSIPPHVLIALAIFLQLPGYPELFVSCDRSRAKKLLRVAMGMPNNERAPSESIAGLKPITRSTRFYETTSNVVTPKPVVPSYSTPVYHPGAIVKQVANVEEVGKSDEEVLALFPFMVLEKLFMYSSPSQIGQQSAQSIRDHALRLGVIDVVLSCLAHFSHQDARFDTLRPSSMDQPVECVQMISQALNLSAHLEALKNACDAQMAQNQSARYHSMFGMGATQAANPSSQQEFWAKGTGFGSGTTQQQWNVNQHVAKRMYEEKLSSTLLNTIAGYIHPKNDPDSADGLVTEEDASKIELDVRLIQLLARSSLLKTIHSYLMNDSVLDISKHGDSHLAAINVILAMATAAPVLHQITMLYGEATNTAEQDDKQVDLFAELLKDTHLGQNLLSGLQKLGGLIDVYLSKLKKDKPAEGEVLVEIEQDEGEETLHKLSTLISQTCAAVKKRLQETDQCHESAPGTSTSLMNVPGDELYMLEMKALQFDSVPFFEKDSKTWRIPYHYQSSISQGGQTMNGKRTRRLAQEIVTLSNSLPLSLSSSVFVRASEERLDMMKILITGPADSAYSNGCFEFDVWFPNDYPNSPMHVNLETTGNQTVRFNPNLYNDGKVCLSILNTWHGRPEERWQPQTSSLLQVIVSIQSLIMVPESFFNEPGYERQRGTPTGMQAAREYDANIRHNTVRWAMIEQLRHPSKAFEGVIKRHFYLKREEICSMITEWITETETHIKTYNDNSKTLSSHLSTLKKNFELLKQEFVKLKVPEGMTPQKSAFLPDPNEKDLPKQPANSTTTSPTTSTSKSSTPTVEKPTDHSKLDELD